MPGEDLQILQGYEENRLWYALYITVCFPSGNVNIPLQRRYCSWEQIISPKHKKVLATGFHHSLSGWKQGGSTLWPWHYLKLIPVISGKNEKKKKKSDHMESSSGFWWVTGRTWFWTQTHSLLSEKLHKVIGQHKYTSPVYHTAPLLRRE